MSIARECRSAWGCRHRRQQVNLYGAHTAALHVEHRVAVLLIKKRIAWFGNALELCEDKAGQGLKARTSREQQIVLRLQIPQADRAF